MAARFVSTSRLSNIVQMISLSRQSGILRVVRGQGPSQEMGQIRFLDGEPVSALLAQLTGNNALNVLMNWGECAYAFDETLIPDGSDSGPGAYGQDPYGYGRSTESGPATGSWPSFGYPNSMPSSSPPAPSPVPYEQQGNGYYTGYGSNTGYGPNTSYPSRQPGMNPDMGYYPAPAPTTSATTSSSLPAMRPEMLRAVPYRMPISEQIDQLPLDRRERMVLLLIDGQRTVADLTRLTRRNDQELYSVLMHLNMLGLIDFRG
jgi:hypothetical protein